MGYKNFISRLFYYLKPHVGKLVFTSAMMIFATVLEGSIPEITGRIIDDVFVGERNTQTALLYAGILLAVITASSLFALTSTAASSWISNKVIMDLRANMFAKLLKLPKAYFDQHPTGETLSKLTYDVEQIANAASTIWLEFVKSFVFVVILITYLFYKSWELSLSLIIFLPLVFLAVKLSSTRMRNSSRKVRQYMGNMTHLLNENISGNSLVKIYNAQNQESNKFFALIQTIRQQRFKVDMASAFNMTFVNILIGLSLTSVVYFSATYLTMTAGEFLSYFTAMGMLVKPSKSLININKPLQIAIAAGESVFGLIDETQEQNTGKKQLKNVKGTIKFNHVSFGYTDQKNVLNNIDLDIKAGETVALVGSTGSGKTTIIQLLAKFYSPKSGSITIDGTDICEFELDSLRTQIAFVDQNVRLFNDTVKGNIALGQTQNMNDEKIKNAAKIANAYDFVEALSEKFDSRIGEDGTKLSGGQRQRLAIARAIAKDSPILILDEATSALDSATERKVQAAIDEMQKDRTTIIIAHRLSTVQKADKIVVLRQGEVTEQGSHQELLSANGEYASLYKHQFN
ncbi:Lipid A export permease/ATP-binding protein MsbA [uncultured Gammaproteobacteria bacterium]|jgi:subfamily B ATP-binding cassette protein MsbA|uniref:lipid A export permease/ATP-binding protein MsbA n=1 Tax=thiotrophic endosymbiont of Bathymodiolus puteoserpentis (Logatchev) TaxID=343240 RepID=UPI0010B96891|nr:lipid A export permease/ATP-binding protein MsbA [thiotrophic endosymbiont of Bathymodiolus puteoserpentis (Logatchev)]CAC9497537.1 Lipid A export permease/ATP-binding protein MsbA [uncultured Gammaproteobacteria bacterium]CAC9499065.1 Lipid A export permease/ATP-binding protein MsbA [uncultured Gammaproteobacteria bacterium]CAC9502352.1 Lipid A export permease/ATP-binding protein MsbA [uncultured Gammaproteobacteria bacterium]CAC9633996.1 Lipid A export permease/ATP-binding protein MsbA [un